MQVFQSPDRVAILGMLLVLGGYTAASERVVSELAGRRGAATKGRSNKGQLLLAVRDAVGEAGTRRANAVGRIHDVAARSGPQDPIRHLALAALYQLYREQRDDDRARQVAEFVWAEAEACRHQLEAMGDQPFYQNGVLSAPGTGARVNSRKELA